MQKSRIIKLSLVVIGLSVAGCTEPVVCYEQGGMCTWTEITRVYCDDFGCYQCDSANNCWAIPSTICTQDNDCSADQYCGAEGKCVSRCKSDDECAPGEVCVACGKCQPAEVPATCGSIPDFCSQTVSCGQGKTCQFGRCHFDCAVDTECPKGQICKNSICQDDTDPMQPECSLNIHCENGTCINGYCHSFCQSSLDCESMMICTVGVCQPDFHPAN